MKRLFSSLLATIVLLSSFVLSCSADYERLDNLVPSATLLGTQITPRATIQTYSINIPSNGAYVEISGFSGEYQKNNVVTVTGTWQPSYAGLTIEFYSDHGYAVLGYLNRSGDTNSFRLQANDTWHVHIKSMSGDAATGTIQFTIT